MHAERLVSLNLNIRGLGQSATLAIKDRVRELRGAGATVFDFGLGQSPFPVPDSVVEALRAAAPQKEYLPVKGLPALRDAVADFHARHDGVDAHPDRVLVGPGSKELMFLVQLVYYGEIILPTPCWVSYLPQAQILGRRISLVHGTAATRWMVSPGQLRDALELVNDHGRPRLLILNYPSNPTGDTLDEETLRELADVARRFNLIVLSDEIYGQLHFEGRHTSIARWYPEGTIISSGLSKWCGAGGWRLGTFSFPPDLAWLVNAMAAAASETYTSVSAPIQHAAIAAFRGGPEIEQYLAHARRLLAALGARSCRVLSEAGIGLLPPAGGFYLWLDFSPLRERLAAHGVRSGKGLCDRLLDEAGVALLPGAAFGRARGELTARLAYVDFDGTAAMRHSERIPLDAPLPDDFIDRRCAGVVEGVARLAGWVRGLPPS
jgi:aspartate aminotransferase